MSVNTVSKVSQENSLQFVKSAIIISNWYILQRNHYIYVYILYLHISISTYIYIYIYIYKCI